MLFNSYHYPRSLCRMIISYLNWFDAVFRFFSLFVCLASSSSLVVFFSFVIKFTDVVLFVFHYVWKKTTLKYNKTWLIYRRTHQHTHIHTHTHQVIRSSSYSHHAYDGGGGGFQCLKKPRELLIVIYVMINEISSNDLVFCYWQFNKQKHFCYVEFVLKIIDI